MTVFNFKPDGTAKALIQLPLHLFLALSCYLVSSFNLLSRLVVTELRKQLTDVLRVDLISKCLSFCSLNMKC